MEYIKLTLEYDSPLASLIRQSLKENHLDIPGTVYFDEGLDHLSDFYAVAGRIYYILVDTQGDLIGGIGLAEFTGFDHCCELQKLYLDGRVKGRGISYEMIAFIEEKARELGYQRIYLETHTNLQAAIHVYEKAGYLEIDRPESVSHSTMNKFFMKEL